MMVRALSVLILWKRKKRAVGGVKTVHFQGVNIAFLLRKQNQRLYFVILFGSR